MPSEVDRGSITYLDGIAAALDAELASDDRVFLMGQDIAEYGGAFKVTRGFVDRFGKGRIVNTPIAESGAIGMAVGAALLGRRPVVEMQFADFISCGFNQLVNVAAKMFWRTHMPVPLVVRCPAGAGMGAGPFHSQSMEAWFLSVPGLKVVVPAFVDDAYSLLRAAIRDPNPVVYMEQKHLYRRLRAPVDLDQVDLTLAGARIRRKGSDAAIIAYGAPVHAAVAASDRLARDGVSARVIDLRVLSPLDEDEILKAARETGRVLFVHEAPLSSGFGAELAARVADRAFEYLDAPLRRLAFADHPVPFAADLEAACLPTENKIVEAVRELVGW